MRGRHGGVKLARPAEQIRIGDVVRASEVTLVAIEEGAAAGARGRGHGVNRVLDDALEAFIDVLDRHTIADMVRSQASAAAPPRGRAGTPARAAGMAGSRTRRSLHHGG
jgi:Rrf2 family nitric oxide-sensitive transcriptional repressor